MEKLKRIFCKHEDEIVKKIQMYESLSGDMLYLRCKKCGRLKEYGYYTTAEQEYLF